jgi:hypothetical protein
VVQSVPLGTTPGTTLTRDDGSQVDVVNVAFAKDDSAIALVVEPITA